MSVELETAISLLLEETLPVTGTFTLPAQEALGLRLAGDIFAPMDNPPFDRSPLDGYTFRAADSIGASRETPRTLRVIGEVCAGEYFSSTVAPGQAVRIMTGAPIPSGCDCVIRQEETDLGETQVALYSQLVPHQNFVDRGEDVRNGALLMQAGERLTAVHLGVLATVGLDQVEVCRPPHAVLLSTGDELTEPGQPLGLGKIYNGSASLLAGRARELGFSLTRAGAFGDSAEAVAQEIRRRLPEVDLVLTTGGVSVGKRDIMPAVMELLGAKVLFHGLRLKPGSPMLCAVVDGTPILCLSGNPFAAAATFELVARPVLARLSGESAMGTRRVEAKLTTPFPKASKGRRFIRGRYREGTVAVDAPNHSSGALCSLLGCNCLVDIPAGTEPLEAGATVTVIL